MSVDESTAAQAASLHTPALWLGVLVPKRHARRAVTRSLLKREMRAGVVRQAQRLAPGLWVVRLRAPFDAGSFRAPPRARCAKRRAPNSMRLLDCCVQRGYALKDAPMATLSLLGCATCRARADRSCARLPSVAQPVAGHAMPIRADLLDIRDRRARTPRRAAGSYLGGAARAALPSVVCRRRRPGTRSTAARLAEPRLPRASAVTAPARLPADTTFTEDRSMTDMRRTLLWVVFSMSLVLLWDAWNKHQGEPSIFGPRRHRADARRRRPRRPPRRCRRLPQPRRRPRSPPPARCPPRRPRRARKSA